jgi:hypothetical protein
MVAALFDTSYLQTEDRPCPTLTGPSQRTRRRTLIAKLDHAIKETFPTSDPVSVTITKGGAIDYDEHGCRDLRVQTECP